MFYEFTFDAGMWLLLLLLQHRQQHLVAQCCEKWCCAHLLAQRSSRFASQTPANGYKIESSIKYRHLQFFDMCSTIHNCTAAHAQNNNNFSG